jgi:hypothetical protein
MDYLLTFVGLLGFYLAGRKVWYAWYLNIACQALWFIYGLTTGQFGFIIGAVFYTAIFSSNAYSWTKEHRKEKTDGTNQTVR